MMWKIGQLKNWTSQNQREAATPVQNISYIQLYCGPNGSRAKIFNYLWIKQSDAMVFTLNIDKVLLNKLFPTVNI